MKNTNAKWRINFSYYRQTVTMMNGEHINIRRKKGRWHKARVPGTIRKSRLPGGNGYRGNQKIDVMKMMRRAHQSELTKAWQEIQAAS